LPVEKKDITLVALAGLIGSGAGIGTGWMNKGADVATVREMDAHMAVLEERGEKRYQRGMEFGEKLERHGLILRDQVVDIRMELVSLKQAFDDHKEKCR